MSGTASGAREARDKLAAARVWLMKHKPFFGVLARALRLERHGGPAPLRLREDDTLAFRPDAIAELPFPALCARLAHVAMHAALDAHGRRQARDARRWNLAHDLAIAPLLDAAALSSGAILVDSDHAELPEGASAEAYYVALSEDAAPPPAWCDLSDPRPDDEVEASPPETRTADLPPEAAVQLPGKTGETADPPPSKLDAQERALEWRMRLAAALEEEIASGGKTFGERPAWVDALVQAAIEPPTHWSAHLQQALSSLTRTERCYLRPSRRMAALAHAEGDWPESVTMPGRKVEPAGRLCVVVDTSASISEGTLARFFGVVVASAGAEGIDDVRLLQADAAITRDETVFAAELLFRPVEVLGRGGTDFAPALAHLAGEARRAAERFTVVYFTDLDGRFPVGDGIDALDVLWVTPPGCEREAPFGRVLRMS